MFILGVYGAHQGKESFKPRLPNAPEVGWDEVGQGPSFSVLNPATLHTEPDLSKLKAKQQKSTKT